MKECSDMEGRGMANCGSPVCRLGAAHGDLTYPERMGLDASRRQALQLLAGAAFGGLAGCHQPEPVLRVASIVFPGYEFMFLARELGLLPAAEVRLMEMRSSTDVISAIGSGRLEAAALTLDEMLTARANGADLRVILVFDISQGADVVLAKPPLLKNV